MGFQQLFEILKTVFEKATRAQGGWIHQNGELEFIKCYDLTRHEIDAHLKIHGTPGILYSKEANDALLQYLDQGHIRFIIYTDSVSIETHTVPNVNQMRTIRKLAKENDEFVWELHLEGKKPVFGKDYQSFLQQVRG